MRVLLAGHVVRSVVDFARRQLYQSSQAAVEEKLSESSTIYHSFGSKEEGR